MKPCKLCPKKKYLNSSWCYSHLKTREKEKREIKKLKKKEKRENKYSVISKRAWNTFARWMKKRDATFQGNFTCYTCNKTLPIEQSQAGHCFHRGRARYKALDFDPNHIKLQCGGCNCFSTIQGNIFQAKLTAELGIEEVEKMIMRRQNELPLTVEELKTLIVKYSQKPENGV